MLIALGCRDPKSMWFRPTLARLRKAHESQHDNKSEPALLEGCEYVITACLPCMKCTTPCMKCVTCRRYAIVSNSTLSLLERHSHSEFILRSMGATTDWPGFWASCSSSHVFCCLSNGEVKVLNCCYALNVWNTAWLMWTSCTLLEILKCFVLINYL